MWLNFFFGSPLRAIITSALLAALFVGVWAQVDAPGANRFMANIWAAVVQVASLLLVVGIAALCFKKALFPGKKKGGNGH